MLASVINGIISIAECSDSRNQVIEDGPLVLLPIDVQI